ncbi:hypothetical protein SAY87_003084 [Trapa incisa]|uniref:Uncharacterized protein n=1 Tax=Trapa incisa TaxID=236973 RepID=A0AAN7QIM0_9MYRT|nr:hypothetical protein SAY87_003084 [Trapa incisa]
MLHSILNANDPNVVSLPLLSDYTTNSNQDQDQDLILPFPLYNFPLSPFTLYPEEDSTLLLYDLLNEPGKQLIDTDGLIDNKGSHISTEKEVPKKRSTKKERHSKINTIHGLRDRRMRLSLEVARKFFDLQDMLGFDKASKTVEWLFTHSKPAIDDLSKRFSSYNLASGRAGESEPEMVSGVTDEGFQLLPDSGKGRKSGRSQPSTRRISSPHMVRESREKARARAKERTVLRKLNFNSGLIMPFEIGGASEEICQLGHGYMKLPFSDVGAAAVSQEPKQARATREQTIEDHPFTNTSDYLQGVGIFQEGQFSDFQIFLKPWEAYSGTSYLC